MRRSVAGVLFPLILIAASAVDASAETVIVSGTNGANGVPSRLAGGPGGAGGAATATTSTPADPTNMAIATGGKGGAGAGGGRRCFMLICVPTSGGAGGAGGLATAKTTTSSSSGSASAVATSTGGAGGTGGAASSGLAGGTGGAGGAGGAASSTATATDATGPALASATAAGGAGGGSPNRAGGAGGNGSASASATSPAASAATGLSSAKGGARGSAAASASAQNALGKAVATAFAPSGDAASTIAKADQGVGFGLVAGQAVSAATHSSNLIANGVMDAAYGGAGQALSYEDTASFTFVTNGPEGMNLDLISNISSGIGFDSLLLRVTINGTLHNYSFSTLGNAQSSFTRDLLDLGVVAGGLQSFSLDYVLTFNSGTKAKAGDGFGFVYDIVDPPPGEPIAGSPVPEASTWGMMALGFAGLAFMRRRGSRISAGGC
jgi:PEP-CTERM motif